MITIPEVQTTVNKEEGKACAGNIQEEVAGNKLLSLDSSKKKIPRVIGKK